MIESAERKLRYLLEHYIVICLFLSLFMLSLLGVGNARMVGLMGVVLCVAGLVQPPEEADLWVLLPLLAYNLISLISSYATYREVVYGYASTQMIFPVLYLLMAVLDSSGIRLLRRLCAGWAGTVAAIGIGRFVLRALTLGTKRLDGLLGNSNATGIFLVMGWFILIGCGEERGPAPLLRRLEPLILAALALTLSMGSFLAMAAGIAVLLFCKKRETAWREAVRFVCRLLAKASLGVGSGILLYLAADRGAPWLIGALVVYLAALAVCWEEYEAALEAFRPLPVLLSALGILVAAAAVLIRPSAIATFAERLEMMRNGLQYLCANPLLGVGPYQWRLLNLADSDKYFNTSHIHNVLIHVGVELGLIAAGMLVIIAVRFFRKEKSPAQRGAFAAFLCHNMIDTSFFYGGITALLLLAVGAPEDGARKTGAGASRAVFAGAGVMFLYDIFRMAVV